MAKQQAIEAGADDVWMVKEGNLVTEGSSNNAWIVRNGTIYTHPATNEILKGITRTAMIKIAADLAINVVEKAFTVQEAYEADEAFITSASIFLLPVIEIDKHVIGDGQAGPVARALYHEYRAYAAGQRGEQLSWKA